MDRREDDLDLQVEVADEAVVDEDEDADVAEELDDASSDEGEDASGDTESSDDPADELVESDSDGEETDGSDVEDHTDSDDGALGEDEEADAVPADDEGDGADNAESAEDAEDASASAASKGAALLAGAKERLAVYWSQARTWMEGHRLATNVGAWVLCLLLIIIVFAVVINVTILHADLELQDREVAGGYIEPVENAELPHMTMRFVSLDDGGFPTMTLNLSCAVPAGHEMPALEAGDFSLKERDADGGTLDVSLGELAFDPGSGSCRMVYATDPGALGPDRTVDITLAKESGFRGKCSVSYRVPGA